MREKKKIEKKFFLWFSEFVVVQFNFDVQFSSLETDIVDEWMEK